MFMMCLFRSLINISLESRSSFFSRAHNSDLRAGNKFILSGLSLSKLACVHVERSNINQGETRSFFFFITKAFHAIHRKSFLSFAGRLNSLKVSFNSTAQFSPCLKPLFMLHSLESCQLTSQQFWIIYSPLNFDFGSFIKMTFIIFVAQP